MDTIKTNNKVFSVVYHTRINSDSYKMAEARDEIQEASFVGSLENTYNYLKTSIGSLFEKVNFMHNKGTYLLTEAGLVGKIAEQLGFNSMLPVRLYVIANNTTIITITIEPRIWGVEEVEDKPVKKAKKGDK